MEIFQKRLNFILLLAALFVLPQYAVANENTRNVAVIDNKASWSDLTFTGSKLLTSINVKIQLGPGNPLPATSAKKTETALVDYSEADNDSKLLTMKWSLKGIVAQGQYEVRVWFKTADGLPFKRTRFRNDGDPWVKTYYWEDTGVRRHKIKPATSAENTQPSASWTDRKEHFYEFPGESADCSSISDPSLIFYILSTLDPEMLQTPKEIYVFVKKQVHRLTIGQIKSSPIEVSFKAKTSSQKEETIKKQITPLVYSIKTTPMVPEKDEAENFSLLGLHKDILIYMDPEKQFPVRINGTNNSIGKIDLELRNIELK